MLGCWYHGLPSLHSLCTSQSFYYALGMVLSPYLSLHYLLYRLLGSIIAVQWLFKIINTFLLFSSIHLILRHQTYLALLHLIIHHPFAFVLYSILCFSFSFYSISQHIGAWRKRDIQIMYTAIRLVSMLVMVNATTSIRVSLLTAVVLAILGFVTQKLKLRHFVQEWRIIQDFFSSRKRGCQVNMGVIDMARSELMTVKSLLRVVVVK